MQNFRNLKVWEKAHALALSVYGVTSSFPREEIYGITNQMRRAAVSISSNIAEGAGRGTDADFLRFLHMSMGSAKELECQLLLSRDLGMLNSETHARLETDLGEIERMLSSLIVRIKPE